MREDTVTYGGQTILFDPDQVSDPTPALFETPEPTTQNSNRLGRGTVFFLKSDQGDRVLKTYRRGGLIRHLVSDQYFFTGLGRTRMVREFRLLAAMTELGLPVPHPVAVSVCQKGPLYRGQLICSRLPARHTLAERLADTPLSAATWRAVGTCIARFHRAGVFHADLNANNIMLADDDVFLIDFDKSEFRTSGDDWRQANLDRLKRSLDKLASTDPGIRVDEDGWTALIEAYNNALA